MHVPQFPLVFGFHSSLSFRVFTSGGSSCVCSTDWDLNFFDWAGTSVESDDNFMMNVLAMEIRTRGLAVDVVDAALFNAIPPWSTWEDVCEDATSFLLPQQSYGWTIDATNVAMSKAIACNFPSCYSRWKPQCGATSGKARIVPGSFGHSMLIAIGATGLPRNIVQLVEIGDQLQKAFLRPSRRVHGKTTIEATEFLRAIRPLAYCVFGCRRKCLFGASVVVVVVAVGAVVAVGVVVASM